MTIVLCRIGRAIQTASMEIVEDGRKRPAGQQTHIVEKFGEHVETCPECSVQLGIKEEP